MPQELKDIIQDEQQFLDDLAAFHEQRGYASLSCLSTVSLQT